MLRYADDGVNSVALDYIVGNKLCLAKSVEIVYVNCAVEGLVGLQEQLLYVSCLMLLPVEDGITGHKHQWVVFDGSTEVVGDQPASAVHNVSNSNRNSAPVPGSHTVITYELYATVSEIKGDTEGHMVTHLYSGSTGTDTGAAGDSDSDSDSWVLFNDYAVWMRSRLQP